VRAAAAQIEGLGRLKRFFSAPVAEAIVSEGEASLLAPHRRDICAAFLDLRGFTAFTDRAEPEEVISVLTEFHAAMGPLIDAHRGTVPHFAGDGVLVFSDIYGATPCNLTSKLVEPGRVEAVAGVNLPMLVRAFTYRAKGMDTMIKKAVSGGCEGVLRLEVDPRYAAARG